MNRARPLTKPKRRYTSELRRKQMEATRELILDALEAQLGTVEGDFSLGDIARAAGVSEATVFRHFSTRQELFDSMSRRASARFELREAIGDSLAKLPASIDPLFRYFENSHQLIAAATRAPALRAYADRARRRRSKRIEQLVGEHAPALDAPTRRAIAGIVHLLMSADGWLWLVDRFGVDHAHARSTVAWTLDVLTRRLARGGPPPPPGESP